MKYINGIKGGEIIENKKFSKKVGTHDGRFHADEVMATAILMEIYNIELIRTRNEEVLKQLDIVYDVGGGEFDHHGIEKTYREDGIPYAAAGLIWKKFGREVIRFHGSTLQENEVESIFEYIDRTLIEGIDALDNGIRPVRSELTLMNIISMVSDFNPNWDLEEGEDEAFIKAVGIASSTLRNSIENKLSVIRARGIVIEAYKKREMPEILVLDKYMPYSEVLREIDERGEVCFVVYGRKDSYALQTVKGIDGEDKKLLPEAWAGRRDEDLAKITGVKDAVFCHTGRFIAIAKTYEGIMKLACFAINGREKGMSKCLKRLYLKLFTRP